MTDSSPSDDRVIKPAHYTRLAIEPITFIMRNGFEMWRGNIISGRRRQGAMPGHDTIGR